MLFPLIAPFLSQTVNKSRFQNLFFKMEVIEKQAETNVMLGNIVVDVELERFDGGVVYQGFNTISTKTTKADVFTGSVVENKLRVKVSTNPPGFHDDVDLYFRTDVDPFVAEINGKSTVLSQGTLTKDETESALHSDFDVWVYEAIDESKTDKNFTKRLDLIGAKFDDKVVGVDDFYVQVFPVYNYLMYAESLHINAYNYIRWKYDKLDGLKLGGTQTAFGAVSVDSGAAGGNYGITSRFTDDVVFYKQSVLTENIMATVIGHELLHTVNGAIIPNSAIDHDGIYSWQKDSSVMSYFGIDVGENNQTYRDHLDTETANIPADYDYETLYNIEF